MKLFYISLKVPLFFIIMSIILFAGLSMNSIDFKNNINSELLGYNYKFNDTVIKLQKVQDHIFLRDKKKYGCWYYKNEFINYLTEGKQPYDTINDIVLMQFSTAYWQSQSKKEKSPMPAKLYLETYYVSTDSIFSWYNKYILNQFIYIDGRDDGELQNYITIHCKREPSSKEFSFLVYKYKLQKFVGNLRISKKDMQHWISATIKVPTASAFLEICRSISKEPFVDWVENHISTGEPTPLD